MKIAIVTEYLANYISGGILCIIEVLNQLAHKGHDVCCFLKGPPYRSDWLKTDFPIYPMSEMNKYDGILVASYSPVAEAVANADNTEHKYFWLHTLEHIFKWNGEEWSKRAYDSYSLPLKIFTTSTYIQIVLESMFNRNVIGQCVPPGIDPQIFYQLQKTQFINPLKVGVLWRSDYVRGCDVAKAGIERAIQMGAKLEPVYFGGIKDRRQMAQVMQNLDIYVDMSRLAGSPTPVIEAMACGVVPICTKYGTNDFVYNDVNGYIVGTDNVVELARTLNGIYHMDDDDIFELSDMAAKKALTRTWDCVSNRVENAQIFFNLKYGNNDEKIKGNYKRLFRLPLL